MAISYQSSPPPLRYLSQRCSASSSRARSSIDRLDLHRLYAALGSAWSFVASVRFSQTCFGFPVADHARNSSSRCFGTSSRFKTVPRRFVFSPI